MVKFDNNNFLYLVQLGWYPRSGGVSVSTKGRLPKIHRIMVFINKLCCQKKVCYCCLQLSVLRTSARCDTCAAFPDALLLSLVMCHVHSVLYALYYVHCAAFLADLEVLQACAELMYCRSCPCMIATVMFSIVHTISSAWCSLMQPTNSQLDEVRMRSKLMRCSSS